MGGESVTTLPPWPLSGGRALSSIISKFKQFKNIGYYTFTKLYDTGVNSVISHIASVYRNDKFGQMVQNRAMKYFLGVHKMPQPMQFKLTWGGLV